MYTSEHTHSVPQDSAQTQRTCHQQIQLEYVFLHFFFFRRVLLKQIFEISEIRKTN